VALVRGTGASQGKKKKVVRAGTQGRGGVNQPTQQGARSVTKHVYRGVSFYSTTGKELPKRWQESIVKAASKVPEKVWDQLAREGTKVFVMPRDDPAMAPKFVEYLKTREAVDSPARLAPPGTPPLTTGQIKEAFLGARDLSYLDKDGHPIAVIGIGAEPPLPRGIEREPVVPSPPGHILGHEVGHTTDQAFGVMLAIGRVYHDLNRKTLRSQVAAAQVISNEKKAPFGYSPNIVSKSPEFRETIPKNYTAGYGDESRLYAPGGERPSEVFAESLANYWDGERKKKLPKKMIQFFDQHFSTGW
jgi:hypothetical protein